VAVEFPINPKALANLLSNAVEISKEAANIATPGSVLLAYQPSPDQKFGHVLAYGCGRYAAGRTRAVLEGLPSNEAMSLSLTTEHAASLATAVRKTSAAASALVRVYMHEEPVEGRNPETGASTWGNLMVTYQDDVLAHLHDSDPAGKFDGIWQRMDELAMNVDAGERMPNLALQVNVLSRLAKLRDVEDVADLRTTQMPGVVAAKLGEHCVALLGEVNRQSYTSGGRWSTGPGSPAHLWSN
jgi:hypothetical protein